MKASVLKSNFIKTLTDLYPSEEVLSFFSILTEKYLGLTRLELALRPNLVVSEENSDRFKNVILRLKNHEPIQYIIGETEFYGLHLKVNRYTLIPRPETEELVDWIINDAKAQDPEPKTLLDIGTGSGCIAISLAKNSLNYKVSAIDISSDAIEIAFQNAVSNDVKVDFSKLDILSAETLSENYDIIVSNPPYVRELEKKEMHTNVLDHEPESALFVSNEDPLVFYRKIGQLASRYLKPNGLLFFEINEYLGDDLVSMLESLGFQEIEVRKDFFGKDRMIKCSKNEQTP